MRILQAEQTALENYFQFLFPKYFDFCMCAEILCWRKLNKVVVAVFVIQFQKI